MCLILGNFFRKQTKRGPFNNSLRDHSERFKNGFTLIELMVVVVIIAIISALVVPLIIGGLNKEKPKEVDKAIRSDSVKTQVRPEPATIRPVTLSADIKVNLDPRHYLHRFKVYTIFSANFQGDFVFQNKDMNNNLIKLTFPFPKGTTQAKDVSFKILDDQGLFVEPEGVKYNLIGISWIGQLPPGQALKVKVAYSAQGRDMFEYIGPGSGRAGLFKLKLNIKGVNPDYIPADALQPNEIKDDYFLWDYNNLITDRKVIVELPGAMSPIGRTILLSKLAALAVLLFGIGFLYLSELRQPGSLDDFRWGHFLLLALNYFLFFVIFIVLSLSGKLAPWLSIPLSAILSLPLLMMHVTRVLDKSFALKNVLPLAIFTLAIVVAGVYGGAYKKYIYIIFVVMAVAFLTITYRSWLAKRKAWRKEKRERSLAEERENKEKQKRLKKEEKLAAELKSIENAAAKEVQAVRTAWKRSEALQWEAELLLESDDYVELQSTRDNISSTLAVLNDFRNQLEEFDRKMSDLINTGDKDERTAFSSEIERKGIMFRQRLDMQIDKLKAFVKEFRELLRNTRTDAQIKSSFCIACGSEKPASKYCPHCGMLCPLELACKKCGRIYPLPVHILSPAKADLPVFCMVCGTEFYLDKNYLQEIIKPFATDDSCSDEKDKA